MLPWPNVMYAQPVDTYSMVVIAEKIKISTSRWIVRHLKFFHNLFIIYKKVHLNMVFLKELRSADCSEDTLTNMPTF